MDFIYLFNFILQLTVFLLCHNYDEIAFGADAIEQNQMEVE